MNVTSRNQAELKEKVTEVIRRLQLLAHTGDLDIDMGGDEDENVFNTLSLHGTEPQFACAVGTVLRDNDCGKKSDLISLCNQFSCIGYVIICIHILKPGLLKRVICCKVHH